MGTYRLRTIFMLGDKGKVLSWGEALQTQNVNTVRRTNLVVIGGVNEGEGEHTLLLEVGLVNTGKRTDNDSEATKITRLESSMFTG